MTLSPKLRSKLKFGFGLIEVMAAATIAASVSSGGYGNVMNRAKAMQCQNNLRQMGLVFKTMGNLPDASFYPTGNPKTDPKSLLVLGKKAGMPESMFICPTAPNEFADKGLTFVWNSNVSGKGAFTVSREWLVTEMNAVAATPTPPHAGKYHVLYGDGSVKAVKTVPAEIQKAKEAAQKKLGNSGNTSKANVKTQTTATVKAAVAVTKPEAVTSPEVTKDNSGFEKGNWVKSVRDGVELFSNKKVVARLSKGQELQVLSTNGGWVGVRVSVNGEWQRGWVKQTNVTD